MVRRSIYKILVPSLLLLVSAVSAERMRPDRGIFSSEAEKLFEQGVEEYGERNFEQAEDRFQKLLEFPLNQRTSAGQLMMARTLFQKGEYQAALEMAKSLERRFSESRYLADARLLTGDCYCVLKRYFEAVTQYGRILATPAPLYLQAQAAERLAAVVENGFINAEGQENLRMAVGERRLNEALLFGRARWYRRLGWTVQSTAAMRVYRERMPDGIFASMMDEVGAADAEFHAPSPQEREENSSPPEQRTWAARQGSPRLGLLLPMSGAQRQIGEELYAGVQLANEQLGEPFELVVADIGIDYGDLPIAESDGSELLRVIHQTRRLIYGEGVLAIVGPVFSSHGVAAAIAAEEAGIPLIAPLAQQSGLDQIGEHVFQLNTIPETQGKALGEYATLVLDLQNLAVIAPLTDYGWNFEREFARVAHLNGGEVVHADWYVPNETKDFKLIFESVRKVGFSLIPPPPPEDSLAMSDSLAWTIDDSTVGEEKEPSFLSELLAGLEEEKKAPEPEEKVEEAPPDSSEIFIDTIDGIVIVVESFEDATTIAPQLYFHRLQTQILGNDIWYEPEAIRQMRPGDRRYIEGTVFVSGYQETNPATRRFIDAFRRRFARDPGYAAYGYDAARLIITGWEQEQHNPAMLREWLQSLHGFEGASGTISFANGRRVNEELVLLKIDQRGRIRPLGNEDLPDLTPIEEDLPRADLDLSEGASGAGETIGRK